MSLRSLRATAGARSGKRRLQIHETYVQIRAPDENQPGQVAPVFYLVEQGVLTVVDAKGKPSTIPPHVLRPDEDPKMIARALAGAAERKTMSSFERPLAYQRRVVV